MLKLRKTIVLNWFLYLSIHCLSLPCGANPYSISNPLDQSKEVEYFVTLPRSSQDQNPVIIFIHGHQPDPRPGGNAFFNDGTLNTFAQKGFIAAAVSQPGYGHSEGPPDYCGPLTQAAVRGVIAELKRRSDVNPSEIYLYGVSRGALVASMVATQDPSLKGVILDAGFYDLRTVRDQRTLSNIAKETMGMIANIEKEAGLDENALHLRSSMDYISQIKFPILMFHGFHDNRAPVSQAIAFYEGLSHLKVPIQLHLFDCGHHTPQEEKDALIDIFLKKSLAS